MPPLIDVLTRLDFLTLSPAAWEEERAAVIPPAYVEDEALRVGLYRRIASTATQKEVDEVHAEVKDRFGKLPVSVEHLLKLARLRIEAARKKITSIETQDEKVLLMRRGDLITPATAFRG